MKLRDAGKLQLTDTLIKYFPDFPNQEFVRTATVGQLLSHRSGLGDFFGADYEKFWDSITEIEQMLPFVYDDTLAFHPGTGFQYSNSGFILAGLIVEKASGMNYFDYIRKSIYMPLGMRNTDSYLRSDTGIALAEPLVRSDTEWKRARQGRRGSSAGGGYSTARDMLIFARGLTRGEIVDGAALAIMTTPKNAGLDDSYPYGYGFTLNVKGQRVISYGHGGIAPGVNFELQYFQAEDITMILFSNQDNGAYDDLRKNIIKLITGDR